MKDVTVSSLSVRERSSALILFVTQPSENENGIDCDTRLPVACTVSISSEF